MEKRNKIMMTITFSPEGKKKLDELMKLDRRSRGEELEHIVELYYKQKKETPSQ